MSNIKVYDKVSWHYPEGKNCPSIDAAKNHFKVVMEWLRKNDLLSKEGIEVYDLGIGSDFSINSAMLTERGNHIFEKYYTKLLKEINYNSKDTLDKLEKLIRP
ncbi:MAG: hypothetical protein NZM09_12470 [Ignavibacterium sp.]|nr:hypothetical protein [Ignavibacterium sp.]MDW8376490.1 hypothetical protein [Ignavibacteriales bacterium]